MRRPLNRIAGFGLVELMVAVAVGMITLLVIMQTLQTAEGQRRAITSGSDAGIGGAIALQTLQRDLMNAGFGSSVDVDLYAGCFGLQVRAFNSQRSTQDIVLPASVFAPVLIFTSNAPPAHLNAAGFDADTDIIQISYSGSNTAVGSGVALNPQTLGATTYSIVIDPNRLVNPGLRAGVHQGDLVVVVQAGVGCVVAQVTSIPTAGIDEYGQAAAGNDSAINHLAGVQFWNWHRNPPACGLEAVPSVWNKNGDPNLGITFTSPNNAPAKLFSLGSPDRFALRAYGIRSGRLAVCSPLLQDCTQADEWQSVGDGIVSLRAQYAYDANADGNITTPSYAANGTITAPGEWTRALPANTVWANLKSIGIAIVARSKQLQRDPIDGATCQPDWAGFPHDTGVAPANRTCANAPLDGELYLASGSDGANWNRYAHQVFETSVPLRSLFWSNN